MCNVFSLAALHAAVFIIIIIINIIIITIIITSLSPYARKTRFLIRHCIYVYVLYLLCMFNDQSNHVL